MDLNNMASVYNEIGQYDEAYKLYLRNLNIDEQLLGVDHPECMTFSPISDCFQFRLKQSEPISTFGPFYCVWGPCGR